MMPKFAIKVGVFDSGVGGKLIAEKIQKTVPNVEVIFKSDPEYFPYGNKTPDVILNRVSHFVTEFQKLDCKVVVIACNSATTNTIGALRHRFPDIKFVGVEPPIKPIVKMTKSGKVAIMGTEATIKSQRLESLVEQHSGDIEVLLVACPGLAEYIEHRQGSDLPKRSYPSAILKNFLDKPVSEGVDAVGMACTHYSYLLSQMRQLYPDVKFYDPTEAVIKQVKQILTNLL